MRARAELALVAVGVCLVGVSGFRILRRAAYQAPSTSCIYPAVRLFNASATHVHLLAKLEIPRLALAVPVVEGDDERDLSIAAGHVPGTKMPGAAGNAVIAAHREAEFRTLRNIALGDRIRIRAEKISIYVVKRIRIVSRNDLTLLQDTNSPTLTLVTCYPFHYLGSAPKRFIVQAELVGS